MNIALLHYSAPPVVGGVESVLAHQAELMAAAGHTVRVLAARGEAWRPHIPVVHLPLADSRHTELLQLKVALDAGRVPPQFETFVAQLAEALPAALAGVDALVAHNVCSLNKNLVLTAALHRLHRAGRLPRLILWHHDLAWTTPRYAAELHPGYPWDLLRTDWPGATQVVVSPLRQQELAQLLGLAPDRIHVIPNGVDLAAFFKLEPLTRNLVDRLELEAAAPLLLMPVRLTRRKNIELALTVLAHLQADWPTARLLVTGPLGPHNPANQTYLTELLAQRAHLGLSTAAHFLAELSPVYLPDAVIADFYRLADALFLPSREEGFGIPLLEAAFARLPVFCTNLPPLRDIGQAQVTYFSPEADPAEVAQLITAALRADTAYQFGARARQAYTWPQVYRRHIEPLLHPAG